jgi:hypothetical protein
MAEWLLEAGCDFNLIQRSGHTALHKAAWGNHKALCEWLKNRVNLWDNIRDVAGMCLDDACLHMINATTTTLRQLCC